MIAIGSFAPEVRGHVGPPRYPERYPLWSCGGISPVVFSTKPLQYLEVQTGTRTCDLRSVSSNRCEHPNSSASGFSTGGELRTIEEGSRCGQMSKRIAHFPLDAPTSSLGMAIEAVLGPLPPTTFRSG